MPRLLAPPPPSDIRLRFLLLASLVATPALALTLIGALSQWRTGLPLLSRAGAEAPASAVPSGAAADLVHTVGSAADAPGPLGETVLPRADAGRSLAPLRTASAPSPANSAMAPAAAPSTGRAATSPMGGMLALLGAATLITLSIAWFGLDMWALRPLRALADTATRIGSGDLNARTNLRHHRSEVGRLAAALDAMVDTLTRCEQDLRQERDFAVQVMNSMGQGLALVSVDGRFEFINNACADMLGTTPHSLLGRNVYEIIRPEDRDQMRLSGRTRRDGRTTTYQARVVRTDGGATDVLITGAPRLQDGAYHGSIVVVTDLSERIAMETALSRSEERYRTLAMQAPVGIVETDAAGRCRFVNDHWRAMTGLTQDQALGDGWLSALHPDDRGTVMREWDAAVVAGREFTAEYRLLRPDGTVTWVSGRAARLTDAAGSTTGFLGTVADISRRKRLEQQLERQAYTDPVTGLANRRLFTERLSGRLAESDDHGDPPAALFLDLDGFKRVNDTLGHAAGDDLLRQVARRLEESLRPKDTVARFGGDEFAILLNHLPTQDDAAAVAERVLAALRRPFLVLGRPVAVTTSIGIAVGGAGVTSADELLRQADVALYRAKSLGKNRWVRFHRMMDERAALLPIRNLAIPCAAIAGSGRCAAPDDCYCTVGAPSVAGADFGELSMDETAAAS